jgi:uroporphyrinogen-III synthase
MSMSKNSFKAARIALLEARMSSEIADMIRRYGGEPYCVPAVRESSLECEDQVASFIDRLSHAQLQTVVFFTGVGVNTLLRVAEKLGRDVELLAALHKVMVVCRGPKPGAALKRLNVPIVASAGEPYTTQELLEAMQPLAVENTNVAVVHYGERNEFLVQKLQDRGAQIEELMLYEWLLPADRAPLRTLVGDIIEHRVDAVVFTSQIQARHLFMVAEDMVAPGTLAHALNTQTIVASVGPTCTAVLQELGVTVHVEPEHPKIGYLMKSLAAYMG